MRTLRVAWRQASAKIALAVIVLIALLAVFGGHFAGSALAQNPNAVLLGPSAHHLLGTDYLGRDVLSRLIAGTGRSVIGALEAVGVGLVLGVLPGLASLWLGRVFEWISMRFVDALMTLPYIVFAVAVTGVLGNTLTAAMIAVGVLIAPRFYRIARAAALGFSRAQYVEAAELFGASRWWILRRHIWSKVLPTLAVTTAQALAGALLIVSSLAFLGLGVEPPLPTWGELLSTDLDYLAQQPWAPLIPGLAIMIAAGALNALADAIGDAKPAQAPDGRGAQGAADSASGGANDGTTGGANGGTSGGTSGGTPDLDADAPTLPTPLAPLALSPKTLSQSPSSDLKERDDANVPAF